MTLKQHQQILELVAAGETLEVIANRLGRSLEAVRRAAAEGRTPQKHIQEPEEIEVKAEIELDEVVDFLSSLPDDGLREVCELASLERKSRRLKQQLLTRLNEK